MATAFLGVAACATCAPLNPAYTFDEFEFYLSDLKAKAVIVPSGTNSPVLEAAQKQNIPIIKLSPVLEREAEIFTLTAQQPAPPKYDGFAQSTDIALLLHTSGTTSRPRLVPLTHANLCISAYNSVTALDLSSSDCCLNVMLLFHIHGLMVIVSSLAAGAGVVCVSGPKFSNFFNCSRRI
jgi:acyl-CoA synthetase (AMP-forming)/AMP-acid ligase II